MSDEVLTEDLLQALVGLTVTQQFAVVELPDLTKGGCHETWAAVKLYRRMYEIAPCCDVEDCTRRAIAMYMDDQRRGYQLCAKHAPAAERTAVRG